MIRTVAERRDRVQVVTWNGTVVEITSAGRDAIAAQLIRHREDVTYETRVYGLEAFLMADANDPVNLDRSDAASVIVAINVLAERAGGARHLEPGVAELQRKLDTELRAAWAEEDAQTQSEEPPDLSLFYPARESGPSTSRAFGVGLSLAVGACLVVLARRIKADRPAQPTDG
jgi:hypothetical protein